MPARRFFAMANAAQKLRAVEQIEQLDIAAISVGGSKWYSDVRERLQMRIDAASGFTPDEAKTPALLSNADLTPEQKVAFAMQQFAYLKRLNGHGG